MGQCTAGEPHLARERQIHVALSENLKTAHLNRFLSQHGARKAHRVHPQIPQRAAAQIWIETDIPFSPQGERERAAHETHVADGSVRFLHDSTPDSVLAAISTRAEGEVVPDF